MAFRGVRLSSLGWRRQMPKNVGVEIGVWFGMDSAVQHSWSINGVVLCSWFAVRKYTVSLTLLNINNKQTKSNTTVWSVHTATCFDPIGSSSGWHLEHIKRRIYIALWKWHVTSYNVFTFQSCFNTVNFRNKIRWYNWAVKMFRKPQMLVQLTVLFHVALSVGPSHYHFEVWCSCQ